MNNELANTAIYSDMSGLSRLRARAAERSPDANKEVARQFEALFLQSMLKAMRQASLLSASSDSEQTRFYQDMIDKQVALELARKKQHRAGLCDRAPTQWSGYRSTVSG